MNNYKYAGAGTDFRPTDKRFPPGKRLTLNFINANVNKAEGSKERT